MEKEITIKATPQALRNAVDRVIVHLLAWAEKHEAEGIPFYLHRETHTIFVKNDVKEQLLEKFGYADKIHPDCQIEGIAYTSFCYEHTALYGTLCEDFYNDVVEFVENAEHLKRIKTLNVFLHLKKAKETEGAQHG